MADLILLDHFADLAGRYELALCDVWGVIHNGQESFPAACDALTRFQAAGGLVVLISNAPRPATAVLGQLDSLNVPRSAWSGFVTSGDATRLALAKRAPGPVWLIGPPRDLTLLEGLQIELADRPEDARLIVCTGLFDDECEAPEDYRARLSICAGLNLEMVCANPDRVVQRGHRLIYCAGALADLYETLGGRVMMAGKPHTPIYEAAFRAAETLMGRPADRSRTLAIGDGMQTDVLGASNQGLDLLFVAAGIHATEVIGPDGRIDAERIEAALAQVGATARYATGALAW